MLMKHFASNEFLSKALLVPSLVSFSESGGRVVAVDEFAATADPFGGALVGAGDGVPFAAATEGSGGVLLDTVGNKSVPGGGTASPGDDWSGVAADGRAQRPVTVLACVPSGHLVAGFPLM